MKRLLIIAIILLAEVVWAFPPTPITPPYAGTESTTGSAGSLKSPATTGKTTITGPGAGATRNITIPDADLTIGTLTNTKACMGTATGFDCNSSTISMSSITGVAITPAEVNGSAHIHLTAAQVSNTIVYNTGQTNADVFLYLPTAASGYSALFTVGTTQAGNHWGVVADTNDKIYLLAADGTVAAGSDAAAVVMTAATIGQSFACWTFKTDAYDWMCKAISIAGSTFAAHAAP